MKKKEKTITIYCPNCNRKFTTKDLRKTYLYCNCGYAGKAAIS